MRKLILLLLAIVLCPFLSYSGGIVTNANQSASYVRMFARDASVEIDAVYFNPAGLAKLDDGFYLSLSNQTITQNKIVVSDYSYLNDAPESEYVGEVSAPLFPDLYAVYKKGKWAVSLGINPIGGGGGATYNNGLPSFEMGVADLVPGLAGLEAVGTAAGVDLGVTGYSLNAFLEGSSVFWGFQLGFTYEFDENLSVYLGGRYVYAKNTYTGYLKDVSVENEGSIVRADEFINGKAIPVIDGTVTNLNNVIAIPDNIAPIISGGGGSLTLDQAEALGYITTEQKNGIIAGLAVVGVTDPTGVTIQQTSDYITAATPTLNGQISQLEATKDKLSATAMLLADQEADVVQVGHGFTPIIGVNISPNEKLNIGIKYEFKTSMSLENSTNKDFITGYTDSGTPITMFPDGEKIKADMPALLSVGIDYKVTSKFNVATGLHYYFDKSANYGHKVGGVNVDNSYLMDANYWEWALGLQYKLNDKFLVSGGYLRAQTGVSEEYQNDLSFSVSSNTFGLGGAWAITPNIKLNVGASYTIYEENTKEYPYNIAGSGTFTTITETYDKDALIIGLGLDFKLFNKKSKEE